MLQEYQMNSSELQTMEDLLVQAKTLFGEPPQLIDFLPLLAMDRLREIEELEIWETPVVGKLDVPIAELIDQFKSDKRRLAEPDFNDIKTETFQYYDTLVAFVPKLLMALIIITISWLLARQLRRISDRALKRQMEDPLLARFLANLIRTVVIIIGFTMALKTLGNGGVTASILAGAGITAFIIGFALRDIGENFLAGIMMVFKWPFRVGDYIESGPVKGKLVALNIREAQVKTQLFFRVRT